MLVGIHDHAAIGVARGAADGLDQRGLGAQEAFLVGVQNGDEAAFGNIQPLAQQVDADQHVKGAEAQVAQDFDPLQRVDVGMHVADLDALFVQVFGQVLGHAFGQRGDQCAEARIRGDTAHLVQQIVDLHVHGADFDLRVQQAGGADHLFGKNAAGLLDLPGSAGVAETKTDCGRMASHSSNFSGRLSMQDGRRKPCSARVNLRRWSPLYMPPICGTETWLSSAEDDGVVGDEFKEGRGRLARGAACEVAGIVFDAVAEAGGFQHLKVEFGALFQPLRFQQLAVAHQLFEALAQLFLDADDGLNLQRRFGRYVVGVGIDADAGRIVRCFSPVRGQIR